MRRRPVGMNPAAPCAPPLASPAQLTRCLPGPDPRAPYRKRGGPSPPLGAQTAPAAPLTGVQTTSRFVRGPLSAVSPGVPSATPFTFAAASFGLMSLRRPVLRRGLDSARRSRLPTPRARAPPPHRVSRRRHLSRSCPRTHHAMRTLSCVAPLLARPRRMCCRSRPPFYHALRCVPGPKVRAHAPWPQKRAHPRLPTRHRPCLPSTHSASPPLTRTPTPA